MSLIISSVPPREGGELVTVFRTSRFVIVLTIAKRVIR